MVVLDCSVAMSWCFEDENSHISRDLLLSLRNQSAIVPSIWNIEVCNVLYSAEKKGRIKKQDTLQFIEFLNALPIEADSSKNNLLNSEIITLCRNYSLSAYDAAYLELALRYSVPLYSFDKLLCHAAHQCGILTTLE